LLHELGHVVAGLSVGFELRTLIVGAFWLTREGRGLKVRFVPRRIGAGGLVHMVPKSAGRLVDRYVRFVLGGPAASFVLLITTVILVFILPGSVGVRVLLVVNLLLVTLAWVPYSAGGFKSDGELLLRLFRNGPAAERLAAILYILALDAQQVEPRDWPRDAVDRVPIPIKDQPFVYSAIFIRYVDALRGGDAGHIAEAIECGLLVGSEIMLPPDARRAFYLAASSFQGIFRNNAALAAAWLESARMIKGAMSREDWDSKARASIALANGDYAHAHDLLKRYLVVLERRPASGLVAMERAHTVDLLRRCAGAAT
jgi:hypothetical protein